MLELPKGTILSIKSLKIINPDKKIALVLHTSAVNFRYEDLAELKELGISTYFPNDTLWELYYLRNSCISEFAKNASYLYNTVNTTNNPFFYLRDLYRGDNKRFKRPDDIFKEDIIVFLFGSSAISHEFIDNVPAYDNVFVISLNRIGDKKLDRPIALKDLADNWEVFKARARSIKENMDPRKIISAPICANDYPEIFSEDSDAKTCKISPYSLKLLNEGGEARIYNSSDLPDGTLLKFFTKVSADNNKQLRLKYLRRLSQNSEWCKFLSLPKEILYNGRTTSDQTAIIGFTMDNFINENVVSLARLASGHWGSLNKNDIMKKIILHYLELEQMQIYPADFSAQNILVDTKTQEVFFIDCDSFEVYNVPSSSYTTAWIHPELDANFGNNRCYRKPYHHHFSLCCLLYQCETELDNPLRQIVEESRYDVTVKVYDGRWRWSDFKFPFDVGCPMNKKIHPEAKYKIWSQLPKNLQSGFADEFLFRRKLSPGEWLSILT